MQVKAKWFFGAVAVALVLIIGASSAYADFDCPPKPKTKIGDLNQDGTYNIFDVVPLVGIAFRGEPRSRLLGADDLNGDGVINIFDVVPLVGIAFRGEPANFSYRVYNLTGTTLDGTSELICDDSLQYRVVGVFSVGEDVDADQQAGIRDSIECPAKTDTLCIQEGVIVQGDTSTATPSAFIVRRSGYVYAGGTADNPIYFTSMLAPGSRERGDWGGVVINGCAVNNNAGGLNQSEGNGGLGGGLDDDDNSGCYKYVIVQFAGREFTLDNELNGITLNSVGRQTVFCYIQVNQNADDGVEWFGGTCNIQYSIVSGIDDDGYDSDLGALWCGQFLIVAQDPTKGSSSNHNGFEWDNHPSGFDNSPRMQPLVLNVTMIGQGHDYQASGGTARHDAMHLRRGAGALINNTVATRFSRALEIDDDPQATHLMTTDSLQVNCTWWYDVEGPTNSGVAGQTRFFDPLQVPGGLDDGNNEIFLNASGVGGPALAEILVEVDDYASWTVTPPDFRPIDPGPVGLAAAGCAPTDIIPISFLEAVLADWPCLDTTAAGAGFIGCIAPNAAAPAWYDNWPSWDQN